jgi:hypothetical protein
MAANAISETNEIFENLSGMTFKVVAELQATNYAQLRITSFSFVISIT